MADYFSHKRRVEFSETDSAGIAHFSSFMIYMEQAEHAFLRHLGLGVFADQGNGWHLSWPRVHVECDYKGSAKFEDELDIQVSVLKLGRKSLTYQFAFHKEGQQIGLGKTVAVCCRVKQGEPLESVAIPTSFSDALSPFLATSPPDKSPQPSNPQLSNTDK